MPVLQNRLLGANRTQASMNLDLMQGLLQHMANRAMLLHFCLAAVVLNTLQCISVVLLGPTRKTLGLPFFSECKNRIVAICIQCLKFMLMSKFEDSVNTEVFVIQETGRERVKLVVGLSLSDKVVFCAG